MRLPQKTITLLKYFASMFSMVGGILIALNLGAAADVASFVLMGVGAACWTTVSVAENEKALLWQNVTFLIVDVVGVCRWLLH